MKSILTLLVSALASCFALSASAADSPQHAVQSTFTPEGTPVNYIMNGFYDTVYGMMEIVGFSNTVYFADDDKTVYVGSLFPRDFPTADLWHKGVIEGDKIRFDCNDVALTLKEDYGTYRLHLGEYVEEDRSWVIRDLVLNYEDGHIYMEDNPVVPQRHIGLCIVNSDGGAVPIYECRCVDLQLYDKSTEFTEVPASATVSDYIYYGDSSFSSTIAQKGRVAVDGNDYYFDSLLPEMGSAWVKGIREGNTITLVNDQYLGNSLGYYLYYNGAERLHYNELYGNYDTTMTDLTMSVGADGTITVDDGGRCFPSAYTAVGYLYYYAQNMRMKPYAGDVPATPPTPTDVVLFDQFNDYGVFSLVFRLENLTKEGNFLNPDCMGYYIYIDDERYTFRKRFYPNIDHDMTLVPYGYVDARNDEYSDIVCRDLNWNVVNLREDMFERVGVQSVYTVDGITHTSPIVYVDLDGHISEVTPDGISSTSPDPSEGGEGRLSVPTWYDISGRRLLPSFGGVGGGCILVNGGKKMLK